MLYGIALDKTFEELLLSKENGPHDIMMEDVESQLLPVLPDDYFQNTEEHLRPKNDSTAQQRYDTAVKLLIRDCAKRNVRIRANIKTRQRTGAFYLFLQTKEMADLYRHFGHDSIVFMDSGFRVNRNAFPITFISILDNFMKGRMVGVLISQFIDEGTYSKCLSELKRGNLGSVEPQCSMTDFDLSEIAAIGNTWPKAVILICSFHAIAGQSKWINRNSPKAYREKLKTLFKKADKSETKAIYSWKAHFAISDNVVRVRNRT